MFETLPTEYLGPVGSLIALIPTYTWANRERWFVKRSTVQKNGITLIIVGLVSMVSNPDLFIYKIPIGILLVAYGILSISLINPRWDMAQNLGNSKITLVILIINVLLQYGIIQL